jgi:hypothetical protein
MNDTLNTSREHRLSEARSVFREMERLLLRVVEDEEISRPMGVDLADEINAVLDRAAKVAF